ncbi:MAG: hypothetical protein NZV14_06370 [Bryobacteraceae bacterium]|nr:hypothetical protein [Bryobacteraceae bacterium]MDW8377767.1 hypothetical protein [Bryobacterales bacterium]
MVLMGILAFWIASSCLWAGEAEALAISAQIQARHLPFGTILDPFVDREGKITGYTRCGDSAIWTGHYLAAEAFRFKVTGSLQARQAVNAALAGIWELVGVTGNDVLARCYVPANSPYAAGILREESHHGYFRGICQGRPCYWVGNTSRDQYLGVFFGLGVAFELIEDAGVRGAISNLITRMLRRLMADGWSVRMPDGDTSTVFWTRADQKLGLLILGRRVNPREFSDDYSRSRFWEAATSGLPVAFETLDPHGSYFKFNLNMATYYHLISLETNRFYRNFYEDTYQLMRRTVDDHGNAHFNMIDRALRGPDPVRDAETRALLEAWLRRPRRDERIDLRGKYRTCGNDERACDPLPVELRVRTDFLWQRSPFLLVGGGAGNIEGAGIDYILPYWMARYYGVYE